MLQLIHGAYSTCSQKVRLCLHEKGLAFESVSAPGGFLSAEYLKLNPNGVVPTLVHDGEPVIESSVIVEYLEEAFPQTPLSLPTLLGRARMRAWLRYIDEVPTAAVRYPSYNQGFVPHKLGLQSEPDFLDRAAQRPLRRHFYEQMGTNGFGETDITNALERLRDTAMRIEKALRACGPWLLGETLTLADICMAPLIDRIDDLGLNWLWRDLPCVPHWHDAWRQRPSFAATFYDGARLSDIYPDIRARAASPSTPLRNMAPRS